jgi:hypothetical protein
MWGGRTLLTGIAVALSLGGGAHAVDPVGNAKRVDKDPGSSIYRFGIFYVTRTAPGGFAVAWEEDRETQATLTYERILFRIYGNTFAPAANPKSANLKGDKRLPGLSRIVPLGADNAYLVYALTRDNDSPDHPEIREAFGQTIALATGTATGPRRLLNSAGISDSLIGIATGLSDGRAVFAWYETDTFDPARGRFITDTGQLKPVNRDFSCCDSGVAQLTSLQPLGNGFVATYLRNSIFPGSNGVSARLFNANGQPVGPATLLKPSTLGPTAKTLSNGRLALFDFVLVNSEPAHYKLVAQLYDTNWVKIGPKKTLLPDLTTTKYVDFAPTLDGGLFMLRTLQNGSVFTRSVRRLDASLARAGSDHTFPSQAFDFFRVAALTGDRAVAVFRDTVSGRDQLFMQILSY